MALKTVQLPSDPPIIALYGESTDVSRLQYTAGESFTVTDMAPSTAQVSEEDFPLTRIMPNGDKLSISIPRYGWSTNSYEVSAQIDLASGGHRGVGSGRSSDATSIRLCIITDKGITFLATVGSTTADIVRSGEGINSTATITFTKSGSFSLTAQNAELYQRYSQYLRDEWIDPAQPSSGFPGSTSTTGGGGGGFDELNDAISTSPLPSLDALSTGFVSIYTPTLSQVKALADYLWVDSLSLTEVWDEFKKMFANPMDALIGFSIMPGTVPKGDTKNIKIGLIDTGVQLTKAASQYYTVNCGTIKVKEYWGSALDYSPYTKFSIYLPYIGTRSINTDDIMGKTVGVKYKIDTLSGACVANIEVNGNVLYSFSGCCATQIPLTSGDWSSLISGAISLAATAIATMGTGAVMSIPASMGKNAAQAMAGVAASTESRLIGQAAGAVGGLSNVLKPDIQRAGPISGSAGLLGQQFPYLIRETPRQSLPKNYPHYIGYPSNITVKLGDISGFTVVENIHLENISATEVEKEEILSLLYSGVIL